MLSMDGHAPALLRVSAHRDGHGLRLRLIGELDVSTSDQLLEAMAALPAGDVERMCLDLSDLAFLDADGATTTRPTTHLAKAPASRRD